MKKLIVPLLFVLAGTCFVTYSFLDTFIIPKKYAPIANSNSSSRSFSFLEMGDESSTSSSSANNNNNSQSSNSSSSSSVEAAVNDGTYYENLTKEQISALFTQEKVFEISETRKRYSDPDIYVDITTDRFEDAGNYYVADIRLRSFRYFKTALAQDTAGENYKEKTSSMCIRHKGIIAIDGDTYGSQKSGYVIRNGTTIRTTKNTSRKKPEDLAIYPNGTFEIFNENDYTFDQIASKGPLHVFSFGPGLVDKGQKIIQKGEEVGTAAGGNRNQRCAIGMIAPLHYAFVVSDGRITESPGLSLYQMGKIMQERLHCYTAYNLDGGGSATMYFDDGTGGTAGALINVCTQENTGGFRPSANPKIEEREISDIVYIGKE